MATSARLLYYFTASTAKALHALKACGAKNVALPFNNVGRLWELGKTRKEFERILMNSGSRHASNPLSYMHFLDDHMGDLDAALQYDSPMLEKSMEHLREHLRRKQAVIPIAAGENWRSWLGRIRAEGEFDTIAVSRFSGNSRGFFGAKWHAIGRDLPCEGFGSADGASWTYAAGVRTMSAWVRRRRERLMLGQRIRQNRTAILRAHADLKDELAACGLDEGAWYSDDTETLYKLSLAAYYRPRLKHMGSFQDNFV